MIMVSEVGHCQLLSWWRPCLSQHEQCLLFWEFLGFVCAAAGEPGVLTSGPLGVQVKAPVTRQVPLRPLLMRAARQQDHPAVAGCSLTPSGSFDFF